MDILETFLEHFEPLPDPRMNNHNHRHKLHDILMIAILGSICGADGWVEIERFGIAKYDWLKGFLALPNGIPSHDTLGRVFALIDPAQFEACFRAWVGSLSVDITKEVIAIDGKTLRRSHNKSQPALHLVSAWACGQRLMLGQVKTPEKSNEITAIPELLKHLDITGSIITIDAMGCQQAIAKQITSQEANYVLALKANQAKLFRDIKAIFKQAKTIQYKKMLHRRKIEKVHDHGRVETRAYTLVSARDPLLFKLRWPGLQGIGQVEVTRTINGKVERSTRYYLTTLSYEYIDDFMKAARNHWHIEINLHWSLDVSFHEDLSRVRTGNAAQNLATIRRIALNLLKQEQTHKNGITCKRKTAGWDNQYLMKVFMAGNKKKDEKCSKAFVNT